MDTSKAKRLFEEILTDKDPGILVRFWDGSEQRFGGRETAVVLTFKTRDVLQSILSNPSIGFGEAYTRGEIEIEGDLGVIIELAYSRDLFSRLSLGNKVRIYWFKLSGRHGINQCKMDVQSHYDRGNAFYSLWLDKAMNYSCAYFKDINEGLEEAQENKNLHILRKIRLGPGERLLDIGCGWGALIRLASIKFGARSVGLTLSREQKDYCEEKIREEGLKGVSEVRLQDYREVPKEEFGSYDKVVSVGMFEHVGREKYDCFFKRVYSFLKKEGLFLLHTISRMEPQDTDPWIYTYIFPGGYIPSIGQVLEAAHGAGFRLIDIEDLRRHYDLTIGHWLNRFEAARDRIRAMMGEEFVRMWRLYLVGARTSFRAGDMYVSQFLFSKGDVSSLPINRGWMHC